MLLSDICEIIMGQSPSSDSYNVKGQGLPFFQGNADFGKLYPSVRLWCNCPIKKQRLEIYWFQLGHLLEQ